MFLFKKIFGHLLMPLPLGLGLIAFGLLLLTLRKRARGWVALLSGVLVLAVASNRAVSLSLTASLEKTFPAVPPIADPVPTSPADSPQNATDPAVEAADPAIAPPNSPDEIAATANSQTDADLAAAAPPEPPAALAGVNFVAVLGSGHGDNSALPAGQRLSVSARARLIEGLRLAKALPDSWLVVSGPRTNPYGHDPAEPTHARMMADAAVELGFPRRRIVEVDTARDTAEEIHALQLFVGDERIALVTSAWHLPRAMQLATAAGLDAHPCPADFISRDTAIPRLSYVTWDAESLVNTTRAWREYLGRAWARMTGPDSS